MGLRATLRRLLHDFDPRRNTSQRLAQRPERPTADLVGSDLVLPLLARDAGSAHVGDREQQQYRADC
jgi:hypothetical protein